MDSLPNLGLPEAVVRVAARSRRSLHQDPLKLVGLAVEAEVNHLAGHLKLVDLAVVKDLLEVVTNLLAVEEAVKSLLQAVPRRRLTKTKMRRMRRRTKRR